MFVTDKGILTTLRLVQSENAFAPMDVTVSEITTCLSVSQPLNISLGTEDVNVTSSIGQLSNKR